MRAFEYLGKVVRVIDGDTLVVNLDLGLRISTEVVVRLVGINAPELVGPTRAAGEAAKAHAIQWLRATPTREGEVFVRTIKNPIDKYGRWLAIIVPAREVEGVLVPVADTLNDAMVKAGHALPHDGGRKASRMTAGVHAIEDAIMAAGTPDPNDGSGR